MAGIGDAIKGAIMGVVPGDAANKVNNAMGKALNGATQSNNNGHTTSGMDQALQNHADKVHPVGQDVQRMHLPSDDGKW